MKIYTVLYQDQNAGPGPNGDGSHIFRSDDKQEAERFAVKKVGYGNHPAIVNCSEVPARIARRWGF